MQTDAVQRRLVDYALALRYEDIPDEVVHAAIVRAIDTLGALIGGFLGEPCRVARALAARVPNGNGATVIGTRLKVAPDMAAFVNATAAREAEMMDFYHWPGSAHGHPSDTLMAVLAAAEYTHASGRDFITAVVLAYEIFCRIADEFKNPNFDHTNFATLAIAVAAGKLSGLEREQLAHCISMAVTPNNMLNQIRVGQLSMFKVTASGIAARAGVFAAMLARAGMEGPHLPFTGKAGWCDHIAATHLKLTTLGGDDIQFRILDTSIKMRPAAAPTLASILAAEQVGAVKPSDVSRVSVETYGWAKHRGGTGEVRWNPQSRESADHSIPYVVACALIDGTVTPRSYHDARLWNPRLRELMQKIEVVENAEFTAAYGKLPVEHHARVTVVLNSGELRVGNTAGTGHDERPGDIQVESKFRMLAGETVGGARTTSILERLWDLEKVKDVAALPPLFLLN